jgi:hypothetical protein
MIQKISSMLKFLKSRSNFKVRRSKIMVPIERSCQGTHIGNMKALSLTIQKMRPMWKFLQTDRQTDRWTGQKLYAPDLSIQEHKNLNFLCYSISVLSKNPFHSLCFLIRGWHSIGSIFIIRGKITTKLPVPVMIQASFGLGLVNVAVLKSVIFIFIF